jgi:hypothetical protein
LASRSASHAQAQPAGELEGRAQVFALLGEKLDEARAAFTESRSPRDEE